MLRYLAQCAVQLVVTGIGIVTVAFFLVRAIPGDPVLYMLGDYATPDAVMALRARLGLDHSLLEQYLLFVRHAMGGDLGRSIVTGQPALSEILASLPSSLELAVAGIFIAVLVGIPLGIASAVRRGSWVDLTITLAALGGISFPVFWLGLVGILVFSHWLPIFPALGASSTEGVFSDLYHLALPAIVLGLSVAAYISRFTRSAMLEVLGQDYVRVARAMGVPERRIVYKLALRNALVPILAVVGVTFAWSLGNAILVEAVFSRPGLGLTLLKAILSRDYQLVQAGVLVLASGIVLVNVSLDVIYGIVDPRLRAA
jgi:ABC-type dipeptide/oligopeptide/nickel transport system permease component